MNKIYAGIGSRETPEWAIGTMKRLGVYFASSGYVLRSGGATGADSAFESGCDEANGKKEIYLPWQNFENNKSDLFRLSECVVQLASEFHPHWNKCSSGARKMHSRNCYQVLGIDLETPADFIICWTKGTGGTEQALRIAKFFNIPIFNLYEYMWKIELEEFLFGGK